MSAPKIIDDNTIQFLATVYTHMKEYMKETWPKLLATIERRKGNAHGTYVALYVRKDDEFEVAAMRHWLADNTTSIFTTFRSGQYVSMIEVDDADRRRHNTYLPLNWQDAQRLYFMRALDGSWQVL